MKGKEKCRALKEIRRQIAEKNDIPYAVSQCSHQGDCKGTCPKCEAELRYLEQELAIRKNFGKAVAIAGISIGACSSLTACAPIEAAQNVTIPSPVEMPAGEVQIGTLPPETPESTQTDWQLLLPNSGDFPGISVPSEVTEGAMPMPTPEINTGMDFDHPTIPVPDEIMEGELEIAPEMVPEPIMGEIIPGEEDIMTLQLEGDIALPEDGRFE